MGAVHGAEGGAGGILIRVIIDVAAPWAFGGGTLSFYENRIC